MSCLLLVDDEPTLLQLLRRYLERKGYTVETCDSAEAALVVFDADPQRFDMVITDLTLPAPMELSSSSGCALRIRRCPD